MSEIADILRRVWALFRREGVTDDLAIVEHVGALLRLGEPQPASEELRPRRPPPAVDDAQVLGLLREAERQVGDAAVLFDRHVVFRLSEMRPGGRYPTPRHIVKLMWGLLQLSAGHSVADFACGSGGFLVHAGARHKLIGCEISPEWARLAWANCALHGKPNADIRIGNALWLDGAYSELRDARYDRVLMNPPFGENVDSALAETRLGMSVSRSETALTLFALNKLANEGRVAVLLPSGLLFGSGSADQYLRKRLVDEVSLEAVISLPRDAFQPFSGLQTHLIVACKAVPSDRAATWVMQAARDGYPSGRARDLTREPEPPNDLPRIEAILSAQAQRWTQRLPAGEPAIGVKVLKEGRRPCAVVVSALGSASLTSVELFLTGPDDAPDQPTRFLLVSALRDEDQTTACIRVPLNGRRAEPIPDRAAYLQSIRRKLGLKKNDADPGRKVVGPDLGVLAVAVDSEGKLLGVAVTHETLRENGYDLRPQTYLKAVKERRVLEAPATLLAQIRQHQAKLIDRIDGLFGRLDMAPIAGQKIPPPVWRGADGDPRPIGKLSEDQEQVWARVVEQVDRVEAGSDAYETPKPFTAEEVQPGGGQATTAARFTLTLLEKMGLIVPMTVVPEGGGERAFYYRLASDRERDQTTADEPERDSK